MDINKPLTKKDVMKKALFFILIIVLILVIFFSILFIKFHETLSIKAFLIGFLGLFVIVGIGAFAGYKSTKKMEKKYSKQTIKRISATSLYIMLVIGILTFIINGFLAIIKKEYIYFIYSGLGLIIIFWELLHLNKIKKQENNSSFNGRDKK